jgi:acetyl-CoA acetyltransferase
MEKSEIDGLILSSSQTGAGNCFWSQTTADQLALEVDFCQTVDIGGCSPTGALARAAIAIDAGLCETVLCLFADTPMRENNVRQRHYQAEWTVPLGVLGPPTLFGFITSRYQHQFGLDYPVRLLDSVMVCDGASGLIVMSRKRAEKKGFDKIAVPIGYGEKTGYQFSKNIVDVTDTGHLPAGQKAFRQAGISAKDIASFHPYDDFIIAIMLQMEMLGFCKKGQGCDFIRERNFNHDGDLPLNTGGGQISAGQVGLAGGGTNLVEAVRQLFGEAGARQVQDTSNAVVTGIGGIPYARNWNTSAVMVLTSAG